VASQSRGRSTRKQRRARARNPLPRQHAGFRIISLLALLLMAVVIIWTQTRNTEKPLRPLAVLAVLADGTPLPNVEVAFYHTKSVHLGAVHTTKTGPDGSAQLPAEQACGKFFCVAKSTDGNVTQDSVSQDDAGRKARLLFDKPSTIRGHVFDQRGIPAESALVSASFARGPSLAETRVGTDGTFVLRGLSGTLQFLTIRARADGYFCAPFEWNQLSARDIDLRFVIAPPLRLRVVLPDGRPYPCAVSVKGRPDLAMSTNAKGLITFQHLDPEQRFYVHVHHLSMTFRNDGFAPREEVQLLQLEKPLTLVGRVIDVLGKPAPDVEVRHQHGPRAWIRTKTDGDGRFELPELPAGTTNVFYETPEGQITSDRVKLEDGTAKTNWLIRLRQH
jgi:5-hydroxyisourate hydrolase-like protein (transthyretin family)